MTNAAAAYIPPELQNIMGTVDTHIRHDAKGNTRQYFQYHPSAFGKCLRNMQYMKYVAMGLIKVEQESFDSKLLRLFGKGHNMHARWESYFTGMGVLRGVWRCLNPLCRMFDDEGVLTSKLSPADAYKAPVRKYGLKEKLGVFQPEKCVCGCNKFAYEEVCVSSEEMNMFGHVDLIVDFSNLDVSRFDGVPVSFDIDKLPKTPVVIDMKTMNDYRWKNSLMRTGPDLGYRVQLCIYANLLDLDYGMLIYENKNNSEARPYKIEKASDTMFDLIKKQAISMNEMAACEKPKLPPPRCSDKSDYECSNCAFKSLCHKSAIWKDKKVLSDKQQKFYGNLIK